MIDVEQLVFDYPARRALHAVDFHINPGSITALVGPNGAGKSTLLRCLAALYRPYSGRVSINGFDTAEQPRRVHQSLGYLSDFFGLYDALSVRRSLQHGCRTHGVDSQRVEPTAQRLGLEAYLDTPAGELSRGLRQRLAIGLAIIHEPRVLLLDEPASGLDPEARIALSELFLALQAQGMTLMVSSHILAELEDYADNVLIIDAGRIIDHHGLREQGADSQIRIDLARADSRLAALLQEQAGVSRLQASEQQASFGFAGDAEARAALLARLLAEGLAVATFAPVERDLQAVYVERMRQGRGEAR
ncbi:MAG: ABC transporter ATP-binding protein [Gammaproteobacteria bacterium]|nr:ABC transporter ATP-binding protein [Gammaproteobacteria bacterium]